MRVSETSLKNKGVRADGSSRSAVVLLCLSCTRAAAGLRIPMGLLWDLVGAKPAELLSAEHLGWQQALQS